MFRSLFPVFPVFPRFPPFFPFSLCFPFVLFLVKHSTHVSVSRISTAPVKRRKRFEDIFELGPVVGKGAMCAVHKCHLKASGEVFAVKVFHLKGPEHHAVLQQLAAEISTHRLISHPNIVR